VLLLSFLSILLIDTVPWNSDVRINVLFNWHWLGWFLRKLHGIAAVVDLTCHTHAAFNIIAFLMWPKFSIFPLTQLHDVFWMFSLSSFYVLY